MKRECVIISRDGSIRGIYSELVASLAKTLGKQPIGRRASHVEFGGDLSQAALSRCDHATLVAENYRITDEVRNKWFADMTPVRGPVLGPYETRQLALDAETTWLLEHNIPVPDPTN